MLDANGEELDPQQEEALKHLGKIVEAAKALGWDIAVPEEEFVTGIVIGEGQYVDRILDAISLDEIDSIKQKIKAAINEVGEGRLTITEFESLVDEVFSGKNDR